MRGEEKWAYMLHNIPGIGNKAMFTLQERFGNCSEIYKADKKDFSGILTGKQIRAFEEQRKNWDVEEEYAHLFRRGIDFIPFFSGNYPEKLKTIPDPPFALYCIGDMPDETKPSVSIIGARNNSEYGRYAAKMFGDKLARMGVQIISGMARGIDGIGQQASIEAGGKTFAVLGSGVDICYPKDNVMLYDAIKSHGGIISEYPPGTQPKPQHFPPRNRIISGLSDVVLVIEARQKSGTFITVDMALEQGRDVFALPGRVCDSLSGGCNQLIKQGASIASAPEDIIEYLKCEVRNESLIASNRNDENDGMKETTAENVAQNPYLAQLNDTQKLVFAELDFYPITLTMIYENVLKKGFDIGVAEVMNVLVELCIMGVAMRNGAGFYKKI